MNTYNDVIAYIEKFLEASEKIFNGFLHDFWEIFENLKIFKFRNIHWKVSFPGLKRKAIRWHFLAQKYRHGIDEGPQISLDTHNILIRRIEASKYDSKEKWKSSLCRTFNTYSRDALKDVLKTPFAFRN